MCLIHGIFKESISIPDTMETMQECFTNMLEQVKFLQLRINYVTKYLKKLLLQYFKGLHLPNHWFTLFTKDLQVFFFKEVSQI